jgi:hypothetical protein
MKEDIIAMSLEAGFYKFDDEGDELWICDLEELKRFFHMAQAAEREACAKVCEAMNKYMDDGEECATAIRARGQA